MGNYRNLRVWHQAMDLVDAVYDAVRKFPKSELFVLSAQMRSSALSIPSNIAEGQGRHTDGDQVRFLRQARGSIFELQTQIEAAKRQHFLNDVTAQKLVVLSNRVGGGLNNLLKSYDKRLNDPTTQGPRSTPTR